MNKIFNNVDLRNLDNEGLAIAIKELNEEKQRREKEKKYQVALNLRNALREFLDSGSEFDYSVIVGISGGELLGLEVECDCDYGTEDINYVEFDPFDTEILRDIMNELTRSLGKLGE